MPSFGPYTAAGFGHQVINSNTTIQDVTTVLVTLGQWASSDVRGPPHALRHVGMVGIGCFPDDDYACDPPSVFWSTAIRWDVQVDMVVQSFENMVAPSVFWKLTDGTTVQITVNTS